MEIAFRRPVDAAAAPADAIITTTPPPRTDDAPATTAAAADARSTASRPTRPRPAAPARPAPAGSFRADIEGLRAVAVLMVLFNHALGWPSGGFLGVDVFFLISGFLITGLMLRDFDRHGTLSFGGFYLRRAKRILPAAVLVILVTVAAAFVLLSAPRAAAVRTDGLWSLFFAENWHLMIEGADYFQATASESPLEHYWSLAVEEQFYLVWPLLILLLLVVARRSSGRTGSGRTIVIALLAIVSASFAWSLLTAVTRPSAAYFDTFGRVWELGLGALIAVSASVWLRLDDRVRPLIAWAGLALVIAGGVLVTSEMLLPAPAALVAVGGAALLVIAGTGGRQRWLWPLTNPATRYIGRISFSLYLWHFPVIFYLGVVFGDDNPLLPALAISLSLVLAVASFHFVEEPFRRMKLAPAAPVGAAPKPSAAASQRLNRGKLANGALIIAAALTTALVIVAVVRVAPAPATALSVTVESTPMATPTPSASGDPVAQPAVDAAAERTTALRDALAATEWPALVPAVADFGTRGRAVIAGEWVADGCLGGDDAPVADPVANAQRCVYGDPAADSARTAVVYGDSMAISYVPAVRAALGEGWAVRVFTLAGCPVSEAPVTRPGGEAYPECDAFREWARSEIAETAPALVFVSEATDNARLASGAEGDDAFVEWSLATRASLDGLAGSTSEVVVMTRPPAGVSLYDCQTPLSSPQDCVRSTEQGFERRAVALRDAVAEAGAGFRLVNTLSWFCNQGECPSFIGTTPVFADGVHLTAAASAAAGPLLAAELADALAAPAGG